MKLVTQLIILMVLVAIPAITSACTNTVPIASAIGSTFQEGNADFQSIDGNITSRWSAKGVGVYLTLDLSKLVKVCSVSVAWYQGDTRVNYFDLSTSLDNVAFTPVYSGNSSLTTNFQTYEITVRSARYVRLTFKGNTAGEWCSINEIKVSQGFSHPAVLLNRDQITIVQNKIAANQEPWKSMLARLKSNSRGSLSYTAIPVSVMSCGQEKPTATDVGCSRSRNDALAAWTQTLIWAYTGDQNYANNAIRILNAWSSTLTKITFDSTNAATKNGPLNAAWLGEMFTRSAELLKHYGSGWSAADSLRFQNMLTGKLDLFDTCQF
jgi:hypothetical protein